MTEKTIHDLQPHLAANRRFWTGWDGSDPEADLCVYRSDVPHVLFNGVMRVRDRPLDEAVIEARRRLAGSSWAWWVGADSDEAVADHLVAQGAEEIMRMPVMAADLTAEVEPSVPAGLTIRRVTDGPGMVDLVNAYAEPLGFPKDATRAMAERHMEYLSRDPGLVHLAGMMDGQTVGTAVVSLGGDVAALYCVATDGRYRRRGVATALTREALRIARAAGHTMATLQASAEGRPVYERIGFTTICDYVLYGFAAQAEH